MNKVKPEAKVQPEDLIYHNTTKSEYLKGGKPTRDSYFGSNKFFDEHYRDQFGPERSAIKLPADAKFLDLRSGTDEAIEFMERVIRADAKTRKYPVGDTEKYIKGLKQEMKSGKLDKPGFGLMDTVEDLKVGKTASGENLYRFFEEEWYGGGNLKKIMKEMDIDAIKLNEELFIPKEVIKKSQAYDPKTLKVVKPKGDK